MKTDLLTTLEITDSHIKLFQSRFSKANATLTFCDIRKMDNPSEEELSKALTGLAAAKKIAFKNLLLMIPRRLGILRQMTLPASDDIEINKMVGLQIINKVPYSREDIIYDYSIIEKETSGYTKILVAIVHRDIVQRYLALLGKAGIHPQKITLSSAGLLNWLNYQKAKVPSDDKGLTVLINIDASDSEICFCQKQKLFFSRSIQFGARDFVPERIAGFVEQIDLTIRSYQKDKMGPDVNHFMMITTKKEVSLLKEQLQNEYKLNIAVRTPIDNLPCSKDLNLSFIWQESGLSIAAVTGPCFSGAEGILNLIPEEIRDTKAVKFKRDQGVKSALLVAGVLILAVGAFNVESYRDARRLSRIKSKMSEMRPATDKAKKMVKVVDFVKDNIYGQAMVAEVISELYRLTPQDIAFRSVSYDAKGGMTIQGFSQSGTSVNNFQSQLVSSPMFKEVNLQYASRSRIFNQELTDFKITCQLVRRKD